MSLLDNEIPIAVKRGLVEPYGLVLAERAASGFSSSRVYRCNSASGQFCLRCWPENTSADKLAEIRVATEATHHAGLPWLPRYFATERNECFLACAEGRLWELTKWMPGVADYLERRSLPRLRSAMRALARLHHCWAAQSRFIVSPAIVVRVQLLQELLSNDVAAILRKKLGETAPDARVRELVYRTSDAIVRFSHVFLTELVSYATQTVRTHFVLRDIWSEHVLFCEDEVSGIIDLGAARCDDPATDVARLLGSLEPSDSEVWNVGFNFYKDLIPEMDCNRVVALDKASCLLSAVQWAKWLLLEGREFSADIGAIYARWRGFLERLDRFPWQAMSESTPLF